MSQYRVLVEMNGRNTFHPTYPLLPGDIILPDYGGTYMKHAPGIAIGGFRLSLDDLEQNCEPAPEARWEIV